MKKVFTAISLLVCMFTNAQDISIIPQPTSVTKKEGSFSISAKTTLQIKSAGQQKAANFFNKFLQEFFIEMLLTWDFLFLNLKRVRRLKRAMR